MTSDGPNTIGTSILNKIFRRGVEDALTQSTNWLDFANANEWMMGVGSTPSLSVKLKLDTTYLTWGILEVIKLKII